MKKKQLLERIEMNEKAIRELRDKLYEKSEDVAVAPDKPYREYLDDLNTSVMSTPWDSDDKFAEHVAYNRLKDFGMEDQMPRPQGKGPMAFIKNMQKQMGLNEADFIQFTDDLMHQPADEPVPQGPTRNPVFMRDDEWLKIAHDHTNSPHRNSHSHPLRNLLRIAIRWSANHERVISPLQVAQDMVELKMARSQSHFKEDDWIDTMGYANLVQMMDDKLKELGFTEGVKVFEQDFNMSIMWMLLEVCRENKVGE